MLSSYESEITFSGGQFERDRIEALEKIVAEHKAMVDRLEGMLSEAPASKQAAAMDTAETSGELRRLQVDVEKLGNELSKVREEKADLEYEMERRSIRGDYDPRETKVLHFKNNPMSQINPKYAPISTPMVRSRPCIKTCRNRASPIWPRARNKHRRIMN